LLDDGVALTGEVGAPILGREAKLAALEEAVTSLKIEFMETLAVGDGANDLAMIQKAGLGVAYHAKPVVAEAAGAAIHHNDLTALLYLQGYSDDDFVETGSGGSTDMAFIAQVLKTDEIATVGLGRQRESKAHGSNESVRIEDAKAHVKELIYYFCAPLS